MPAGVSALGSLDQRRMTDELRDWSLRLAEPADEKVREVMDVFRELHHVVGFATCGEVCCGEVDLTCLSRPVPTFEITSLA